MSEDSDQAGLLAAAFKVVKEQSFQMKRAMDGDSLDQALEHCTEMLRELRTNSMSPKNYYELYMKITDEMREFEDYINSMQQNGRPMVDLYEKVQTCGNIVPRMYLMICVGCVYIKSMQAPAKDILKDLVEMVKGVQHPTRGLFLRYYLNQCSKQRLPDVGSMYEKNGGGTVQDAYEYLLQNFIETNRLWVRLQNQGAAKDKKKREQERKDLKLLVGSNIVRISQLEGLSMEEYKERVLPKLLEEIISSKDTIAQNYLIDCIIQVFPDEFHIHTLDIFLKSITELKEKVDARTILESMMGRLSQHTANTNTPIPPEINAFKLFNDCISTLIETRSNMSLPETLKLQTGLINFALKCYKTRMDYVAHCLNTCSMLIEKSDFTSANSNPDERATDDTTAQIELLLSAPLSTLALRVLEITSFGKLMTYLPWGNWKEVALNFLKSVVERRAILGDTSQVEQLLATITPLLRDREPASATAAEDGESKAVNPALATEQNCVAKFVHLLQSEDTDALLKMLVVARKQFALGGPSRIKFTMPSLIFRALDLARRVYRRERAAEEEKDSAPQYNTKKVLQFVMEILAGMSASHPELTAKLYLQAAQCADEHGYHAISYQYMQDCIGIFEEHISDSKLQVQVLTAMIGTLLNCKNFPKDDYETFITQLARFCNKLVKKTDQCKMVTLVSHGFWPHGNESDEEKYSIPLKWLIA